MISMTAYIILLIAYIIMATVSFWNVKRNMELRQQCTKLKEQRITLYARCHALTDGKLCVMCNYECPYRETEPGDWSGVPHPEEDEEDDEEV